MRHANGGFTLAELLPAGLIMITALLAGLRFLQLSLIAHEGTGEFHLAQAAFERVRESWMTGQGMVAVTIRKDNTHWEVYEFPDLSWLPLSGFEESGDSSAILWRRTVRPNPDQSYRLWDVENRPAGQHDWKWWSAFLEWENQDAEAE